MAGYFHYLGHSFLLCKMKVFNLASVFSLGVLRLGTRGVYKPLELLSGIVWVHEQTPRVHFSRKILKRFYDTSKPFEP